MKAWVRSAAVLLVSTIAAVGAVDVVLTQDDAQKCSGMYSKKSWGGKVEPFIMVKFIETDKKQPVEDPTVAVVIWEWKDSNLLGKPADLPVDEPRICQSPRTRL